MASRRRTPLSRLAEAADRVARTTIEALADGAIVMLVSEIGGWLVPAAIAHHDELRAITLRELVAQPSAAHAPPYGHAMASLEPRVFSPLAGDDELGKGLASLRASLASILIAPIWGKRRVLGTITAIRDRGGAPMNAQDAILLASIASGAGRALEAAALPTAVEGGEIDAARAMDALAAALAAPMDVERVARATLGIVADVFDAPLVEMAIERRVGPTIFLSSLPEGEREPIPATSAVAAVLGDDQEIHSPTPASWRARFSHEAELLREEPELGALSCVPLVADDRRLGALTVVSPDDVSLLGEGRALLRRLAKLAAQTIARAELLAGERRTHQRWELLAEAWRLAATLDRGDIARSLGSMLVPSFADACAVDLVGDVGLMRVAQTGVSLPPPSLELVRTPRSASVPIAARDHTFGVLVLARDDGRDPFDDDDHRFVLELARRCALALDNARLYDESRRAVAARDRFLSIAGHELRTPLSALNLYVYSLGDGRQDDRLDYATRQIQRLDNLVDRLLEVSRLTSGRIVLERAPTDLADVVADVMKQLEPQASALHVAIAVAVESIVGDWDRTRIEQILVNLLSNALRYGDGAPIDLRAERIGERARVRVRDEGPGIAPEVHAHLFERYEPSVSVRPNQGLGLGLWITRQLVEAHAGTIEVKTEVGVGTEFVIDLPTELVQ